MKLTQSELFDECFVNSTELLVELLNIKKSTEESPVAALIGIRNCLEKIEKIKKQLESASDELVRSPLMQFPSKELLQEFDPDYFHKDRWEGDRKKWTHDRAYHALATWLFDHGSTFKESLKKIESKLGYAVALIAQSNYTEGNHDT